MLPLYGAWIEDLGQSDFARVDCGACHHVALPAPEFLLRLGLSPQTEVLDLKEQVRCRGCGSEGTRRRVDQVASAQHVTGAAQRQSLSTAAVLPAPVSMWPPPEFRQRRIIRAVLEQRIARAEVPDSRRSRFGGH
jgi:hypothetical protein